jgi:3',5'-cyclic-AMP phosphodiesterase
MAVLAQITDLHLGSADRSVDREARLRAAVAAVAALRPAPDALLISGDLSDRGAEEDYAVVADAVGGLAVPVHVLMGNHDDRAALRAVLGGGEGTGDAPYRVDAPLGDARLLGIDTTVPGSDDGTISAAELDWLESRIPPDRRTPVILAMHHPPVLTGIVAADAWTPPAEERDELASMLSTTPQIRRVVAGHVHRTVFATLGGCGVALCPGISSTIALDLDPAGSAGLELLVDPPAVMVHVVSRVGDPLTHVVPVG